METKKEKIEKKEKEKEKEKEECCEKFTIKLTKGSGSNKWQTIVTTLT